MLFSMTILITCVKIKIVEEGFINRTIYYFWQVSSERRVTEILRDVSIGDENSKAVTLYYLSVASELTHHIFVTSQSILLLENNRVWSTFFRVLDSFFSRTQTCDFESAAQTASTFTETRVFPSLTYTAFTMNDKRRQCSPVFCLVQPRACDTGGLLHRFRQARRRPWCNTRASSREIAMEVPIHDRGCNVCVRLRRNLVTLFAPFDTEI